MSKTKIEWCDYTINPVMGCTFGCEFCYAKMLNNRFKWIENWEEPQVRLNQLEKIKKIKKPSIIFMNSMSDIADWHRSVCQETFYQINEASKNINHIFLFLSKRPYLLRKNYFYNYFSCVNNCYVGYSYMGGKDRKLNTFLSDIWYHKNKFLSIEPLLKEPVLEDENLKHLKWIIIGAETGNRKNKIVPEKECVDKIVCFAKDNNIPVFMKDSLIKIVGEENMLREFPKEFYRGEAKTND